MVDICAPEEDLDFFPETPKIKRHKPDLSPKPELKLAFQDKIDFTVPKSNTGINYCIKHHSVLCKHCSLQRRAYRDQVIQYRLFHQENNSLIQGDNPSTIQATHDQGVQTESILTTPEDSETQPDIYPCGFCKCCTCPRDRLHELRTFRRRRPYKANITPSPLILISNTSTSGTTMKKAIQSLLDLPLVIPRCYQTI